MFTPEFINEEEGFYVLVANHFVETDKAVELSIAYNEARLRYGAAHLPKNVNKCRLVYDARGQNLSAENLKKIQDAYAQIYSLEFLD